MSILCCIYFFFVRSHASYKYDENYNNNIILAKHSTLYICFNMRGRCNKKKNLQDNLKEEKKAARVFPFLQYMQWVYT